VIFITFTIFKIF